MNRCNALTKTGKRCKRSYDPDKSYEPTCFQHYLKATNMERKIGEPILLGNNILVFPKMSSINSSSWEIRGKPKVTKKEVQKVIQDIITLNSDREVTEKEKLVHVIEAYDSQKCPIRVWIGRLIFDGSKRPVVGRFLN